jgi:Spy/CpxP family protein refolding chaperone
MTRKILLTAALVLLMAATTFAQPNDNEGGQWQNGRGNRARLRERIDRMKKSQITEVLNLDEETSQKLFPLMDKFQEQRHALRRQQVDLMNQLKNELAKQPADSAAIQNTLDAFKRNQLELVETRNQQLDELGTILTQEQVAKLVVSMPRFMRNMRDMMEDVRARRRQRDCSMDAPGDWQQCPLGNQPMRRRMNPWFSDQSDIPPVEQGQNQDQETF